MSLAFGACSEVFGLVICNSNWFCCVVGTELKFMPELTKKLSESSKAMDAVSVAHKALAGVKAGYFNISCNFDGFMLNIVNAGMSPQPSFLVALAEILAMGPMRIVAFFVLRGWYDTIHSSQKHLQTKK